MHLPLPSIHLLHRDVIMFNTSTTFLLQLGYENQMVTCFCDEQCNGSPMSNISEIKVQIRATSIELLI